MPRLLHCKLENSIAGKENRSTRYRVGRKLTAREHPPVEWRRKPNADPVLTDMKAVALVATRRLPNPNDDDKRAQPYTTTDASALVVL